MSEESKRVLDEESTPREEPERENKPETPEDPYALLRRISKGTLKLAQPFRAASRDVEEVDYDFCALTGEELLDALDSVPAINYMTVTNLQGLRLFAVAAAKCAPFVDTNGSNKTLLYDSRDICKRLSGVDALRAVMLAKNFYAASFRVAKPNSSSD